MKKRYSKLIVTMFAGIFSLYACNTQTGDLSKKAVTGGANITVSLKGLNETFKTKDNTSGVFEKGISDIKEATFVLTTSDTQPATSIVFASSQITYDPNLTTFTFSNIPPGGPYFAAIHLSGFIPRLDGSGNPVLDGSGNPIMDRINLLENADFIISTVPFIMSSNSVTVNSDFTLTPDTPLTITPQLLNRRGAKLDINIIPQQGGTPAPVSITEL